MTVMKTLQDKKIMKIISRVKGNIAMVWVTLARLCFIAVSLVLTHIMVSYGDMVFSSRILGLDIIPGILMYIELLLSGYLSFQDLCDCHAMVMLLNTIGLMTALIYAVYLQNQNLIPRILMYFGAIMFSTMIRKFKSRLRKQSELVMDQNRLLMEKEKELKRLAYFDDLTGFFNRKQFLEEMEQQIDIKSKENGSFYVVFIDVDDFKAINDEVGHYAGDVVLVKISERMRELIHEEDIIGRLGGDEIGMIITRDIEKSEVSEYIRLLKDRIHQPMIVEGKELMVSVSFGIAVFPEDGMTTVELLKQADKAMYNSKGKGKNRFTFSS